MDDQRTLSDKLSGRIRRPTEAGGWKTLEGRIYRSPYASGYVGSMDLPPMPPNMISAHPKDIPGASKLLVGGVGIPLFAGKRIQWLGQPLFAVAGENIDTVDQWLSKIHLDVRDIDETPHEDDDFIKRKGNPDETFANAFQVIEETFHIPDTNIGAEAVGVSCLRDGKSYHIHTASSWPNLVRKSVSRVLKIPLDNIAVRPYPSEPGFKSHSEIWWPAQLAATASLLSWKAKRSVRIALNPEETLNAPRWPGGHFHMKAAIDPNGRLLGIKVDMTIIVGALFPFSTEIINRIILGIFGIYPCRHYMITGRIRRHPRCPSTFGPGGGFEIGYLVGGLIASKIASHCLLSPTQWKREYLSAPGSSIGPGILRPKDYPVQRMLNRILELSDYERKWASCEQNRLNRKKLNQKQDCNQGAGLASAWFGNGFMPPARDVSHASVEVTLEKNGEMTIALPLVAREPLLRAWSLLANAILSIEKKSIHFSVELPDLENGPAILGRNVELYTRLLESAFTALSKKRFRAPLPITVKRIKRRSGQAVWNAELLHGTAFESYSWGITTVEVEMSSHTLKINTIRVRLIIDGGRLLLPKNALSAVKNTAEKALLWCLGHPIIRPNIQIDVHFHQSTGKKHPKDVSTLPWLLVPAAFFEALRQASDCNIDAFPATPKNLYSQGAYR